MARKYDLARMIAEAAEDEGKTSETSKVVVSQEDIARLVAKKSRTRKKKRGDPNQ